MTKLFLPLLAAALLIPGSATAGPVSLESLLREMVDREQIAKVPKPFYICRQFSSYDRRSKGPDQPNWFANWDRSQFVRVDEIDGRREHVMLDADGPGAIVRIWATWHGPHRDGKRQPFSNGTMRVYLDGNPEPAISGPIADLISGDKLIGPPFSESVSPDTVYERRGHNLYLPIPYAMHCKVTYESDAITDVGAKKGEALYYQINYRSYDAGTAVESFQQDQLDEQKLMLAAVGHRLAASGAGHLRTAVGRQFEDELPGGVAPFEWFRADEAGAIRELTIKLEADNLPQALRSTVLEMEFDGERTVWCPVGDFFGTGYLPCPYQSWYTKVDKDGTMHCYWAMPWEKSARVRFHKLGRQRVRMKASARMTAYEWDDRSMHFHATWRQLTKVETGPGGRKDMDGGGAVDVNYATIKGQGTVIGDTLTLFNGTSAWWGEGDEKIYIDGESFPSHIGTGTEDYYGYAWCRPEMFDSPFHAQPCGDGNLKGGFSVNSRYRMLDAMPFRKSLQFDMELWHWESTRMNYAPATFWYARPGATCNIEPDPKSAAGPVAIRRSDVVETFAVKGAIEGEDLKILDVTGGEAKVQNVPKYRWSNDSQLWWIDAKPGDKLTIGLNVPETGDYKLTACLTKAVDYGIIRLSIDGQPLGEALDRYATEVAHDRVDFGSHRLEMGTRRLEIEITGSHPKALKRHMFGLDYLLLERDGE